MDIVTKIAPICLALIMLGLGLGLSLKDFTRVLRTPKDFFVGFFSQLLILPIVALGIALILDLSAPIAVGLMIIAAAPGGAVSYTHLRAHETKANLVCRLLLEKKKKNKIKKSC